MPYVHSYIVPTPPPSNSPGNFTPGAAYSLANTADVINYSWDLAGEQLYNLGIKMTDIAGDTGWILASAPDPISTTDVAAPSVTEPSIIIPSSIDTSTILDTFHTEYGLLIAELVSKFTVFRTDYFPNDTADYLAVETWLKDALANESGLPTAVRDQITSDAFALVGADKLRAQDAVIQQFAARRFPMPSGQAASAILQIEQKAQDAMAESSRKITIASIEQLKWAADKVLSLRQLAMGNALEYIKALVSGPQIASTVTGIGYDAQTKLISAASQFYNARTDVAKLTASVSQFNKSTALEAAVKNQAAELAIIEDRLKALLTECQTIGQAATALFNNLHASVGTSYAVNGT